MKEAMWRTAQGVWMRIADMDTSHIQASINKIQRSTKGWRKDRLPDLQLELEIRSMGLRGNKS